MSISPRSGARVLQTLICFKYYIVHWDEKIDSLQCSMLSKIPIISKNALNRSCSALNFLQKSQWTYMSISHRSAAMELHRFICLKYCNLVKWESPFQSQNIWNTSIFRAPSSTCRGDTQARPLTFLYEM